MVGARWLWAGLAVAAGLACVFVFVQAKGLAERSIDIERLVAESADGGWEELRDPSALGGFSPDTVVAKIAGPTNAPTAARAFDTPDGALGMVVAVRAPTNDDADGLTASALRTASVNTLDGLPPGVRGGNLAPGRGVIYGYTRNRDSVLVVVPNATTQEARQLLDGQLDYHDRALRSVSPTGYHYGYAVGVAVRRYLLPTALLAALAVVVAKRRRPPLDTTTEVSGTPAAVAP